MNNENSPSPTFGVKEAGLMLLGVLALLASVIMEEYQVILVVIGTALMSVSAVIAAGSGGKSGHPEQ